MFSSGTRVPRHDRISWMHILKSGMNDSTSTDMGRKISTRRLVHVFKDFQCFSEVFIPIDVGWGLLSEFVHNETSLITVGTKMQVA